MATISIRLYHRDEENPLHVSKNLKEMWIHCKDGITDYKGYTLEQWADGDMETLCSLSYLMATFKVWGSRKDKR